MVEGKLYAVENGTVVGSSSAVPRTQAGISTGTIDGTETVVPM